MYRYGRSHPTRGTGPRRTRTRGRGAENAEVVAARPYARAAVARVAASATGTPGHPAPGSLAPVWVAAASIAQLGSQRAVSWWARVLAVRRRRLRAGIGEARTVAR